MARYAEELKEPGEIALWERILEKEGEKFVTSGRGSVPGVPFTYEIPDYKMDGKKVKGAELRISSRSKTITRSTVMLAYRKAVEMGGAVKGPKSLGNIYGASYVFAILKELGEIG